MRRVFFTRGFCAAHRVWNDPGKCRNLHGHNYEANVMIDVEQGGLTDQGFVVGFDAVKDVIDFFDHTLVLDENDPLLEPLHQLDSFCIRPVPGVPSTEFLATLLTKRIGDAVMNANPQAKRFVVEVALRETPGIEAFGRDEWQRP